MMISPTSVLLDDVVGVALVPDLVESKLGTKVFVFLVVIVTIKVSRRDGGSVDESNGKGQCRLHHHQGVKTFFFLCVLWSLFLC